MHPLIDLHCDTLFRINGCDESIISNTGNTDVRWMEKAGNVTTCFALFTYPEKGKSPWQQASLLHARYIQEIASADGRLRHVKKPSLHTNQSTQSAILSIEDSYILEGCIDRITELAQWNVRLATLTWNFENELGFPHHKRGGLKPFGFAAVEAMEHHDILVDVSHLNDEGLSDILSIAKKPIIASHSNCRTITNNSRNLSDDAIRAIAQKGGVVGLTFCPSFLSTDWLHSRVDDMVRHALHLYKIGGASTLAIGTDFDGMSGELEIAHYPQFMLLWDALHKKGLPSSILEKMWYDNARRVLT
jgi:membrane dipeptidase